MSDHILDLAGGFGDGTRAEWQSLADKALRGAAFETLVSTTEDGIKRGPLFTQDDAPSETTITKASTPHLAGRPWHITTEIEHPDINHANKNILADLKGGASALSLNIDPSGKYGIALRNKTDLSRLLSGVYDTLVPLHLVPSTGNFEAASLLAAHYRSHKDLGNIHLSLGFVPGPDDQDKMQSLCQWTRTNAPHWKALSVNGAALHEDGASPAQELAFMAARAVSYLRPLVKAYGADKAFALIDVRFAADQDAHFNIIKFRAARLIWSKLAHEFGAKTEHTDLSLHAVSSMRMLAVQDPWANILRLNSACFGAVCGGADYITLLPFTRKIGLPTPFARRLSRNIQLLQMEETRLGHVQDPAHGSYMHESLTHELAEKSWSLFQDIEQRGGWFGAFDWFMEKVKTTEKTRAQKIENGEIFLVGVNQFVKPDVRKAKVLPQPIIKTRMGEVMNTRDFKRAINAADEGLLLPIHGGRYEP